MKVEITKEMEEMAALEELFCAAAELGAAVGAFDAERAWSRIRQLGAKLEIVEGDERVIALAQATHRICSAVEGAS